MKVRLQDIPNGSKIVIGNRDITVGHIEGIFAVCTANDPVKGDYVVHLSALAELRQVGDHYELE